MSHITPDTLHRTAKVFMDNGRAASPEDAMALLEGFGLTVMVGPEIAHSLNHQIALLTLVNTARRTFLGGIFVVGLPDARTLVDLTQATDLKSAVAELGGRVVDAAPAGMPAALIGSVDAPADAVSTWRLTWQGWRGGVVPWRGSMGDTTGEAIALAPSLAAAICAAEVFAFHSGDHPMAGKRSAGMSLWNPQGDWLAASPDEPVLVALPSRLWLIGLGNLGQAVSWLLATLPYPPEPRTSIVLQDFDSLAESNDSTSLLSSPVLVGTKKARHVAAWLQERGFDVAIEERKFGPWTHRAPHEPGVAICGVDNPNARMSLDVAGFDLVVEAGLGAGPQGFRSFSVHSFPASRTAAEIWSGQAKIASPDVAGNPAYAVLKDRGVDACGLAQLATRTVGVPFVGLTASIVLLSELLRRISGGEGSELISSSLLTIDDVVFVPTQAPIYEYGHVAV